MSKSRIDKVETPLDLQVFFHDVLGLPPQKLEELYEFGESKDGYIYAKNREKAWLNSEEFKKLAKALTEIGGEYVRGELTFRLPGPTFKKQSTSQDVRSPPPQPPIPVVREEAPAEALSRPASEGVPIADDLMYQGWQHVRGQILPQANINTFMKDCFYDYKITPLFLPINDDRVIVAGFIDIRHSEMWFPVDRQKDLLWFDGEKMYPDGKEPFSQEVFRERKRSVIERILRQSVIAKLVAEGWQTQENVSLKNGRIDVQGSKENELILVECKGASGLNNVAHALGQLLFYREQLSQQKVRLAIALPDSPDDNQKAVLAKYAIEIFVITSPSEKSIEQKRVEGWKQAR